MNLKEPLVVLGPILLLAALLLSYFTMPAPVQVREVVVEKQVKTLSIERVIEVCHNDFKAWAVFYGEGGWFIAPKPALSSDNRNITQMHGRRCDGTEEKHPKAELEDEDK